jgi:hypothetical protein
MTEESMFSRSIDFKPAKPENENLSRETDGVEGRRGVIVQFILQGPNCILVYSLETNWMLGEPQPPRTYPNNNITEYIDPTKGRAWFHWEKPFYEGQEPEKQECPFFCGRPCFKHPHFPTHLHLFFYERLVKEGATGLWGLMELHLSSYLPEHGVDWDTVCRDY